MKKKNNSQRAGGICYKDPFRQHDAVRRQKITWVHSIFLLVYFPSSLERWLQKWLRWNLLTSFRQTFFIF